MIIDSHHHFWEYNPVEYDWINEDMNIIRHNFLPEDLKDEIAATGINGVISVQARQKLAETNWLLELAEKNKFIKGVIGWLPIDDPQFKLYLDKYSENHKLSGIRYVIQDEPDPEFILRKEFNKGITELKHYGLAYDILIHENQLPNTVCFVDKHPEQIFILDHIAKPKIKEELFEPWRGNIKELAKRENVYCKLSGMVTEADSSGCIKEKLIPYFEICLEAFGATRLMFGSDWPVCLLAISYSEWIKIIKEFISKLNIEEQTCILYKNAIKAYDLRLSN